MSTARRLDPMANLPSRAEGAVRRSLQSLATLQEERGSWAGDYGGPMFLLPMYVGLCHATGQVVPEPKRARMVTYFTNVQRDDGSLGLHAESVAGSMFTTALGYMALRMLGVPKDDARVSRMRAWIHAQGTPLGAASWGKFTLCLLGLYDWDGIHPVPPELWLLPRNVPAHPGNLWCHCRQVYLPMAWLYGTRSTAKADALVQALRDELYDGRWSSIDWAKHRDTVVGADDYRPMTSMMQAVNKAAAQAERLPWKPLRKKALAEVFEHILYEDKVTNFIDIGPVNKVLNTFVHHFQEPGGENFRRAFAACDLYLWDGHDGMKMQGYNNSELWDTAFAVQAIASTGLAQDPDVARMVERAYGFIRDNQILEDVPEHEKYFRHPSKGGWPFSNRPHGWPITDCTSEGLKCALLLEGRFEPEIPKDLLRDAVRLLFTWQNDDGGWATYEKKRGPDWLEQLNPSQVFGDIMVDYSHVECTAACVQALARARARFPGEFDEAIGQAVARGASFLRGTQRPDGSWEGAWAVCFTYGTWFAVSGLLAAGVSKDDPAIARACEFLFAHQKPDGSWGEHGDSCRERRYLQAERGLVANTAWAVLTLVRAGRGADPRVAKAVDFLCCTQADDGSWAREPLVGVFNRTCLINYDNYRHYFPLWALGEWRAAAAADR